MLNMFGLLLNRLSVVFPRIEICDLTHDTRTHNTHMENLSAHESLAFCRRKQNYIKF